MTEQRNKNTKYAKYIVMGIVILAIFLVISVIQFVNNTQKVTVERRISRFVENMTAIQFSKQKIDVFVHGAMAERDTYLYGLLHSEQNLEFWRIYSVEVSAYIDFSEFSEENIHRRDHTIRLDLPRAQIENLDSLEFQLESEYLFWDYDIRLDAVETMNQNTEDIARSELFGMIDQQKIIETAQDEAKEWIAMLVMESTEYSREDISFNFISAPSSQRTLSD